MDQQSVNSSVIHIEFDPVPHTYMVNGRSVPSVTQVLSVLNEFEGVDPAVLAAAADFGTKVHDAVALQCRDQLNWVTLDPAIVPYVRQFENYLSHTGVEVIASEVVVADPVLGYAGNLDLVLLDNKGLIQVDIKSGAVPRSVGAQTAAYANAYNKTHSQIRRRACLQLTGVGDLPKLFALTNPADMTLFQSCLNVFRFQHPERIAT